MVKSVNIIESKRLLDSFFKVDEAIIQHEKYDGSMSKPMSRLVIERGDAVAAIVLNTDTNLFYLIEQFRYATHLRQHGWLKEIVAGMIDKDELPEVAMDRELKEEIGYAPNLLMPIATIFSSAGTSSEKLYLFYAETNNSMKVKLGEYHLDEDEDIRVLEVKKENLMDLISQDGTLDSKTLITILWVLQHK